MPNAFFKQPMYLGPTGDPEDFNEPTLLYPGQLGGRVSVKQPGPGGTASGEDYQHKAYQLVATDSTMAVAPFPGAVAWWQDKAAYRVTTTVTALGRGRVAGVFGRTTITKGNYCFVQWKGLATVKYVDAPTAAPDATGMFVIPSATNGKADCLAAGSAPTYPPLGYAAGTRNALTSEGLVDLDVPQTV